MGEYGLTKYAFQQRRYLVVKCLIQYPLVFLFHSLIIKKYVAAYLINKYPSTVTTRYEREPWSSGYGRRTRVQEVVGLNPNNVYGREIFRIDFSVKM